MDEDRELERRLEAMFGSARPRRGFEDDLWRRLQASRPWPERLRGWLRSPALLAPALAAVVVAAVGVGWLAGNVHPGGFPAATSSSAGSGATGAQFAPAFGVLPAPGGSAKSVPGTAPGTSIANNPVPFSGSVPALPAELNVYRYDEPTASELQAAAAALSAKSGLPVQVAASDPAAGTEPSFLIGGLAVPVGGDQAAAAQAYLADHHLLPTFAYRLVLEPDRVVYARQFENAAGPVRQSLPSGRPAGLEVDFRAGAIVSVSGPLDLSLATAGYPLRPATQALAGGAPEDATAAAGGRAYNQAALVYVLVVSGGHGYYEPELLLTGSAGAELLPVIAPQWLGG